MLQLVKSGLIAIGLCGAFTAAAQANNATIDFGGLTCTDHRGTPALVMHEDEYNAQADDPQMVMYAGARYLRGDVSDRHNTSQPNDIQGPVIVYDDALSRFMAPEQAQFVFLHECFHLNSGDAVTNYVDANLTAESIDLMELAADCYAVRRLRDEFDLQAEGLARIETLARAVTPYRAEDARIENIRACYAAP